MGKGRLLHCTPAPIIFAIKGEFFVKPRFSFFACIILLIISAGAMAMPTDSIGIKWVTGRKMIAHSIDKGETLYAVSRKYKVGIDLIKEYNPDYFGPRGYNQGDIVYVPIGPRPEGQPIPAPKVKETPQQGPAAVLTQTPKPAPAPVYHTVKPKESLSALSRQYHISIAELMEKNHLTTTGLDIGQVLLISGTPLNSKIEADKLVPGKGEKFSPKIIAAYNPEISGKSATVQVNEKVTASAIDDGSVESTRALGLHSSAPAGTLIKVTNPMNGQSLIVKVIASMPKDNQNPNCTMKITRSAAEKLGLRDNYFVVQTQYSRAE